MKYENLKKWKFLWKPLAILYNMEHSDMQTRTEPPTRHVFLLKIFEANRRVHSSFHFTYVSHKKEAKKVKDEFNRSNEEEVEEEEAKKQKKAR